MDLSNSPNLSTILEIKNHGWEGTIDYEIVGNQNLSWSMQFNIAHNDQINVTSPQSIARPKNVVPQNGNFFLYTDKGESMGSIYGLLNEGVYTSDEDAVARDLNGNVITNNGLPVMMKYGFFGDYTFKGGDTKYTDMNYDGKITGEDMVYLGNVNPEFTGGFGSTLRFRNLTLACNFHYRTGNKIINQTALDSEGLYTVNNQSKELLNRWRVQGEPTEGLNPRAYLNHPCNYIGSDKYVESGSFVRMNYLNLGYSFDSAFCQKFQVKDLSINLSGQRLFTSSRYSGMNPASELSDMNKDKSRIYPPKIYSVSIKITI